MTPLKWLGLCCWAGAKETELAIVSGPPARPRSPWGFAASAERSYLPRIRRMPAANSTAPPRAGWRTYSLAMLARDRPCSALRPIAMIVSGATMRTISATIPAKRRISARVGVRTVSGRFASWG